MLWARVPTASTEQNMQNFGRRVLSASLSRYGYFYILLRSICNIFTFICGEWVVRLLIIVRKLDLMLYDSAAFQAQDGSIRFQNLNTAMVLYRPLFLKRLWRCTTASITRRTSIIWTLPKINLTKRFLKVCGSSFYDWCFPLYKLSLLSYI